MMSDRDEKKPTGAHRLGPLVAAEIHDGFVQGVVGSHMILQGLLAEETALDEQTRSLLAEATSHLAASIAEARRLIEQLSPLEITGQLADQIADWICQESQIQAAHELVTEGDCEGLDPRIAGTIFRIAQEAVRNADNHGQANKIQLRLQRDSTGVRLVVFDDGCGFNPNQVAAGRFGLEAMRQRTVWFGGDLTIDSTIGEGTTIRAEFPTTG
jgi:signal transduction histidine kinase